MKINQSENLQQFLQILKEIKSDGTKLTYDINPFFHKFIIDDLKSKNIAITNETINNVVLTHLFNTFDSLVENDKLLILFSYVILSYFLDNLDNDSKEAVLKIIDSKQVVDLSKKEYKSLLDLNVLDIRKSIVVKLMNFKVEEDYVRLQNESRTLKIWIVKAIVIFMLSGFSILTLVYFIPYMHDTALGESLKLIVTKMVDIFKLILLSKS